MELWKKGKVPHYNEDFLDGFVPSMDPHIVKGSKSCVILCPGGAYHNRSKGYEGTLVAEWFNSIGVSAFVFDYRHAPYKHPVPVIDAKRAVRYARYLADEYGYDKDKIGIMGFSAGGHLAGSAGTFKGDFGYEKQDVIDEESSRPDFMVLCYPVISFIEYAHRGSFEQLSEDRLPAAALKLSVDKNVDETTPPTFLWHTVGDNEVPVENSFLMASALSRYDIPFELHTFAKGLHGVGLANGIDRAPDIKTTAMWTDNLKNWLDTMGYTD
ncbi:MAG: alpha/beta hydrolase [Clostridia bacterium]|nr:alpha/beta hydrolase [Clostridia bacterium]